MSDSLRGRWYNREEWYSICSRHKVYNWECKLCNIGTWNSVWRLRIDWAFYWLMPRLWRWQISRGERPRKFIQRKRLDRTPPKDRT